MFDIGWGELVVIGVVALIAIGPKELPGVLRSLGQAMTKIRRMASEFQGQFQEAMREAEVADLKKTADELTGSVSGFTNFDPLSETKKDIETAFDDKPAATAEPAALPEVKIDIPLPEPLASVTSADFAQAPTAPAAPAESATPARPPQPQSGSGAKSAT